MTDAAAVAAAMQDVIRAHTAALHPGRSCIENERGECADRFGDPNPCPSRPTPNRLDDDECALVVREGVGVMCAHADHQHVDRASDGADGKPLPHISFADQLIARHGQPMRDAIDRARVRYEADKAAARQPRRRWWRRLTRALAGRWLHVLTPGFLGELVNDIWSHTRHRLTRRFDR